MDLLKLRKVTGTWLATHTGKVFCILPYILENIEEFCGWMSYATFIDIITLSYLSSLLDVTMQ